MKSAIPFLIGLLLSCNAVVAQIKKPTIMIVPSDVWCNTNGYMMEFENQGSTVKIPDYKKAFQENFELGFALSTINGLMAERGFPLKNLESVLKSLEINAAEDNMISSKNTGTGISETPIDKLKKVAKADIIMQLSWKINETGPKKEISFNLQGLDSYTNKQVASASGTGNPSFSADLSSMLEEAAVDHIDDFNNQLMTHFEDVQEFGREVVVMIRKWDDWGNDLESTYGENNDELSIIIEDWIADNAYEGRFSTTDVTENMMLFEQVRIPLYFERNGRQRAMDTRQFAKNLSDFLKSEPYNIVSKVSTRGLGMAVVYLGGK